MNIINLTMHDATEEQIRAGVFEPRDKESVKEALLFTTLPTKEDVVKKAKALTEIARLEVADAAMIGGALYLMPALAAELKAHGITPYFAFTEREAVEKTNEAGEVVKTSVFRFKGFVEA